LRDKLDDDDEFSVEVNKCFSFSFVTYRYETSNALAVAADGTKINTQPVGTEHTKFHVNVDDD